MLQNVHPAQKVYTGPLGASAVYFLSKDCRSMIKEFCLAYSQTNTMQLQKILTE